MRKALATAMLGMRNVRNFLTLLVAVLAHFSIHREGAVGI
jgi:hypothetical protein